MNYLTFHHTPECLRASAYTNSTPFGPLAVGAMTCSYKRKLTDGSQTHAPLPDGRWEGERRSGSYIVAVRYASTGIKPVVGSLDKLHTKLPTKITEKTKNIVQLDCLFSKLVDAVFTLLIGVCFVSFILI